MKRKLYFTYVF
jgi:hypothetical protein